MKINLLDFAKIWMHHNNNCKYEIRDFHELISSRLEDFMLGRSKKNLIVNAPPRFGKSDLIIRIWLPFVYSAIPDCNFIVAGATFSLCKEHVESIRNTLRSPWYREMFPWGATLERENKDAKKKKTFIEKSTQLAYQFNTLQGGMTKAIGLMGTITGTGSGRMRENLFGGCAIVDDITREQDFRSEGKKQKAYDWYKSTIFYRRNSMKDVPIILLQQRVYHDDLTGRLLEEEADNWDLIKIKALDESKNFSVWEKKAPTDFLLSMKNSKTEIDKFNFLTKYQQEPPHDLCCMISPSWWAYYENLPNDINHRIITMDTAYKNKTYNDESVIQLWGFNKKNLYLIEMIHGRWEFPELLKNTKDFYKKHNVYLNNSKIDGVYIEDKASGTSLAQTLKLEGVPTFLWLPKKGDAKDKVSRVLEASKFIANGEVLLPKNKECSKQLVKQCASFSVDGSTHDDMVDSMTMAISIKQRFF